MYVVDFSNPLNLTIQESYKRSIDLGISRVIRVIGFTNDLDNYSRSYDQLNLAILALLEQEGIDLFDVNILSDTETYKNWQYNHN